jgi:signal peptidase II
LSGKRTLPPWLWTAAVLAADFLTKRLVLAHAADLQPHREVIGDLARLTYVRNAGAAMGIFDGGRGLLIAVSALTSLFLVLLYARSGPVQRGRRAALAAILGGALGNLVDRIFYGGRVVDFIDLGFGPHRFYTFNVADMGVTLGGAALFLILVAESRAEARREAACRAAAGGEGEAGPAHGTADGQLAGTSDAPDAGTAAEPAAGPAAGTPAGPPAP